MKVGKWVKTSLGLTGPKVPIICGEVLELVHGGCTIQTDDGPQIVEAEDVLDVGTRAVILAEDEPESKSTYRQARNTSWVKTPDGRRTRDCNDLVACVMRMPHVGDRIALAVGWVNALGYTRLGHGSRKYSVNLKDCRKRWGHLRAGTMALTLNNVLRGAVTKARGKGMNDADILRCWGVDSDQLHTATGYPSDEVV